MNEEQKIFNKVIKKRRKRVKRLANPMRKLRVVSQLPIENKIVVNKVDKEKKMGWYWWLPLIIAILFALYLLLRI